MIAKLVISQRVMLQLTGYKARMNANRFSKPQNIFFPEERCFASNETI
jgi:hypothetical protein